MAVICLHAPQPVVAGGPTGAHEQRRSDDLDGFYLMLGPLGTISYLHHSWEGAFGGQFLGVVVRENARLSSVGLALGGLHHTESAGGRVYLDALLGTRIAGVHAGLSLGALARIDGVAPPRWGAQATVWLFTGIVPYARAGQLERDGAFFELGLQIMLPALRL